jgi:hypothetical protein
MVSPPEPTVTVFEQLRRSLNELLERATRPEDRREVVARMKDTLVRARLGVDDLKDSLAQSRRKLEAERRELETVRRRKELAARIQDTETVVVAERFERQHEERVRVLDEKVNVQARELELAESELEQMKGELRNAMTGIPPSPAGAPLDDPLFDEAVKARQDIDALARERARQDRDADAERRLEELKRRMGK